MENQYLNFLKTIQINNTAWEYISTGKGHKTFLIFPGGGQTAQGNFRLIEELKKDYKVIAITIYNCSSIDECCQAIDQVLEKEKINKDIIVYGLSLGGLVAQSFLKREKSKIIAAIFSHACTPKSRRYLFKIIIPLLVANVFLPLVSDRLMRFLALKLARRVQGNSNSNKSQAISVEIEEANTFFAKEYWQKYFNKTGFRTWINLHLDFYYHEKFQKEDLVNWPGKVLILRADNDPLMQDEGNFKNVYPQAEVFTFSGTGHLAYYLQFDLMIRVIKKFLSDL